MRIKHLCIHLLLSHLSGQRTIYFSLASAALIKFIKLFKFREFITNAYNVLYIIYTSFRFYKQEKKRWFHARNKNAAINKLYAYLVPLKILKLQPCNSLKSAIKIMLIRFKKGTQHLR